MVLQMILEVQQRMLDNQVRILGAIAEVARRTDPPKPPEDGAIGRD